MLSLSLDAETSNGNYPKKLKLAFGSCYGMMHFKSDIFRTIGEYDPHLWLWLGDAVYLDDISKAACNNLYHISFVLCVVQDDNSMPLEYVHERYQQTMNDPCKKKHGD